MGSANLLVPISLLVFVLATGASFATVGGRTAMLVSLLAGWILLPHFDGRASFLVIHSKASLVPAVVLACSLLLDPGPWRTLRPRWVDLPVVVLCVTPFLSAVANGLGGYEGASSALDTGLSWGAPYLLGRAYLRTWRAQRQAAAALATAGLACVPFCLWEVRMSPQLQYEVYGFRSSGFDTVMRYGGYRPEAFMQSGLAVGMFMASAALAAAWLWRTGARRRIGPLPAGWASIVLAGTTVLCKSTGAILLLLAGLAVLELSFRLRTALLVAVLAVVPALYCTARTSGWSGEAVTRAAAVISEERAASIRFRADNENILVEKALARPWLGWGRFGRSFGYDEDGNRTTVVDGMWIIQMGMGGLVALVSIGFILAVPVLLFVRRFAPRTWVDPRLAGAAALAVIVLLWAVDDLLNSMMAPMYPLVAGGLVSFVPGSARAPLRKRPSGGTTGPSRPRPPRPASPAPRRSPGRC